MRKLRVTDRGAELAGRAVAAVEAADPATVLAMLRPLAGDSQTSRPAASS
jgi:hypothetical protein